MKKNCYRKSCDLKPWQAPHSLLNNLLPKP